MRPRPRSIADQGGLQAHLKAIGVDWHQFCYLDDNKFNNTVIGKLLGYNRNTIRQWRQIRKVENETNTSTDS